MIGEKLEMTEMGERSPSSRELKSWEAQLATSRARTEVEALSVNDEVIYRANVLNLWETGKIITSSPREGVIFCCQNEKLDVTEVTDVANIKKLDIAGLISCKVEGALMDSMVSAVAQEQGRSIQLLAIESGSLRALDVLDMNNIPILLAHKRRQNIIHVVASILDAEIVRTVLSWFTEKMEIRGAGGTDKTSLWRKCRAMNWQDMNGNTPLHIAAENCNLSFLEEVRRLNLTENDAWLPWKMLETKSARHMRPGDCCERPDVKQFFEDWYDDNRKHHAAERKKVLERIATWQIDWSLIKVGEKIGEGSFGKVHVAEWRGTPVAIKRLYANALTVNARLFEKEITTMRRLHHPKVVQFLGFAMSSETAGLCMVMELFGHGSIEDYIKRGNHVSWQTSIRWCADMAQSLAYIHNLKPDHIIHRDIKPGNFMLTDSLKVKLGDFGIARLFDSADNKIKKQISAGKLPDIDYDDTITSPNRDVSLTMSYRQKLSFIPKLTSHFGQDNSSYSLGQDNKDFLSQTIYSDLEMTSNCGTVRFMAPEVIGGNEHNIETGLSNYSRQADIWSVGLVYYYIFERVLPYIPGCNTPAKHAVAIRKGRRPPFVRTRTDMKEIIDQCLAMDKKQRPTAEDLIHLVSAVPLVRSFPLCCMKVTPPAAAVKKAAAIRERLTSRVYPSTPEKSSSRAILFKDS